MLAGVPVLAAAFVTGIGFEIFGVQWDTAVQHHVPPEALSRVYAYDSVGSLVFNQLGQTLAGPAMAVLGLGGAIGLSYHGDPRRDAARARGPRRADAPALRGGLTPATAG